LYWIIEDFAVIELLDWVLAFEPCQFDAKIVRLATVSLHHIFIHILNRKHQLYPSLSRSLSQRNERVAFKSALQVVAITVLTCKAPSSDCERNPQPPSRFTSTQPPVVRKRRTKPSRHYGSCKFIAIITWFFTSFLSVHPTFFTSRISTPVLPSGTMEHLTLKMEALDAGYEAHDEYLCNYKSRSRKDHGRTDPESPTQYRNNRSGNRASNRPQIDHDIFEGLPVRRWHLEKFHYGAPQKKESKEEQYPYPELPMPKDSNLYPPFSQQLLRAARRGLPNKPQVPTTEEDAEGEEVDNDEWKGFVAPRWMPIPRDEEPPEPEYLAKRRKGLPPIYGVNAVNTAATTSTPMKIKLRKIEADGQTTYVPDNQAIEGGNEVGLVEMADAPAPGTVIEGVGVVNAEGLVVPGDVNPQPTPPRRRPPPPKRKAKGPGRGRKKKVMFAPGEGADNITDDATTVDGTDGGHVSTADGAEPEKMEGIETANGDNPSGVGDDSTLQDAEDDENDNDEGDESGEDGESGEEVQTQVPSIGEATTSATTEPIAEQPSPGDASSSPDLPLAVAQHSRTPTLETAPIMETAPTVETKAEGDFVGERDVVQEAAESSMSVPLDTVAESIPMEVEEAEAPNEVSNAVLPEELAGTDCLTEPISTNVDDAVTPENATHASVVPNAAEEQSAFPKQAEVYFDNGDVDLLGTLEKSLEGAVANDGAVRQDNEAQLDRPTSPGTKEGELVVVEKLEETPAEKYEEELMEKPEENMVEGQAPVEVKEEDVADSMEPTATANVEEGGGH
jgi:hypothetical protein